jgi:hypothetical protein
MGCLSYRCQYGSLCFSNTAIGLTRDAAQRRHARARRLTATHCSAGGRRSNTSATTSAGSTPGTAIWAVTAALSRLAVPGVGQRGCRGWVRARHGAQRCSGCFDGRGTQAPLLRACALSRSLTRRKRRAAARAAFKRRAPAAGVRSGHGRLPRRAACRKLMLALIQYGSCLCSALGLRPCSSSGCSTIVLCTIGLLDGWR